MDWLIFLNIKCLIKYRNSYKQKEVFVCLWLTVNFDFRLLEDNGLFKIEFNPQEVGSFIMDVYITGVKIQDSPIFFKAYDSSLIQVSDVKSGIVGQPCQFRVDASQAGEGQLEISINDGEVPNHVQVKFSKLTKQ